ncbi:hypothetical protein OESDEN_01031 [Oesophagostomum dentatum]|uniref:Uncharacterized protein n=1 Tax=Oesophagostomum dentatum TaxID=61180 RepID=A0A0B1TNY1_OESDE|nr:hypothetical protein OESDEN_01031 [Oesophagostomum dentatum]
MLLSYSAQFSLLTINWWSRIARFYLDFVTKNTQNHLLKNLAVIAEWESSLRRFVRFAVEDRLKSDERCEVAFDRAVTPAHTLRVSSCQPNEVRVRTTFFGNISTPILTRILNMVHSEKAAVVLCVYSISIESILRSSVDGCPLPLRILRKNIPGCKIEEAVLEDTFSDHRLALTRDDSSSSDTEWYFVLSSDSLSHISTYAMSLHLKLDAPPGSLFLAQFVLVSRTDLDDASA